MRPTRVAEPTQIASPPTPRRVVGFVPGPRAIGSFVPKLAAKSFERFGFSAAAILTDWTAIVGEQLASYTAPERLKWPRETHGDNSKGDGKAEGKGERRRPTERDGATLILRVDGARALDVQYKTRQIIERINAYFGYRAVIEIRILQAPVAAKKPAVSSGKGPLRAATPARVASPPIAPASNNLTEIKDAQLRAALERLGCSVNGVLGR